MKRREFVLGSARVMGAAWLVSRGLGRMMQALPAHPQKLDAYETVTLGRTGIQTSLLAMGTGTVGSVHHSNQTALGMKGLPDLLLNGYDHGLRFFDAADSYGSHPHVAEALKRVPRDKVTVLTKTWARDANSARADLDRFRKELGTDYIDICLMHCLTEADWTDRFQPVMDVLSEAKQKGVIRAHGCSCHSIEALESAAKSPWVDVHLVRINPLGAYMDARPDTVVSVMREMRSNRHAIVGMKILGQGELRNRQDEALRYALSLDLLDAFTIGAESKFEQDDLVRRIAQA